MTETIRTIRIATQGPAGPPGSGSSQVFSVASQAAMLALAAQVGDIAVRSDISTSFVLAASDPSQIANWTEILAPGGGGGAVTSVAGRTGAVTLSAADISGLAASATSDTTNAGNISSGTLSNGRLSGVALTANNLSDLANVATARGNLGLAASATTDTTNAGNISSGTLLDARLSANAARRDQDNAFGDHAISRFCGVVSTQTADYTLQAADNGTIVFVNKATAVTVTLPNSLPAGFNCVLVQEGAGQVTFATASGATKQSPGGASKTAAQYGSVALLVKANAGGSAADWRLDGALTA
jgi:hypothetical protein